jgi:hypothetical protein
MAFTLDPKSVRGIQAVNRVGVDKFQKGWVKFGNDKLNINTTSAVGLEKAIGVVGRFFMKIQSKINEIFYGKFSSGKEDTNLIKRLLNKGIINLLEGIASVDFCNILNYSLNQVPDGKAFDPNQQPPTNEPILRKKWQLQKTAYDVQQFIDEYYREYLDTNNPQSKVGLFLLLQQINSSFSSIVSTVDTGLNDPDIRQNFPQVSVASNFLQNVLGVFNRYTNINEIPSQEIQRLIGLIDKVRQYCIIIQGLNNPKNAIGLVDSSLNGAIQKELSDISRLILNPDKAATVLKSIIKTVNTINNIAQKILGFINTLKVIIKICIALIRVFKILQRFFEKDPVSGAIYPEGVSRKIIFKIRDVIKNAGETRLTLRLEQITAVLNLAAIIVTSLLAAIQNIIGKLQLIQRNLESCTNKNETLLNEINEAINNLTSTSAQLNDFLTQYNNQQKAAESQFGGYTIQIVTEQVVDEGINLKRRYGIAKDSNQYVVVQSTPTFASLDLIIVNEVKALLVSKGLVNTGLSNVDPQDQVTILEAARFLGEDGTELANIQLTESDIDTVQNLSDETGLQEFINNLPGGRALRRRMRSVMLRNLQQLGTDLKSTDPQGKFSSGLIKQQQSENNKLEIQDLEDKISGWKKEIIVATTQGFVGLAIIRDRTLKIKDAEKKIQQLRQG